MPKGRGKKGLAAVAADGGGIKVCGKERPWNADKDSQGQGA